MSELPEIWRDNFIDLNNLLDRWFERAIPIPYLLDGYNCDGGTYIVFNIKEQNPVYIGHTNRTLQTRIIEHRNNRTQHSYAGTSLLGQALYENPEEYSIYVINDNKEDELPLIRKLRPEFNRGGLSVNDRTGKAKEVYEEEQERHRKQIALQQKQQYYFWDIMGDIDNLLRNFRYKACSFVSDATWDCAKNQLEIEQVKSDAWNILLKNLPNLRNEIIDKIQESLTR